MEPGYSKILINENVIPNIGVLEGDFIRFVHDLVGVLIRENRKAMEESLAPVGLRVTGIWNDNPGTERKFD